MGRYRVTWEPIWHRGLDFLLPGQGAGSRLCASKADAQTFIRRLRERGIVLGPEAGREILGSELKITCRPEKA